MIRKLVETDRSTAVALLAESPQMNLYPLGNMEALGFNNEVCEFLGDFADGTGALRGVLNRYMNGWTIWGSRDADWSALAHAIDTHPIVAARLQDNPGGIDSILPFLRRYRASTVSIEELMSLAPEDFRDVTPPQGVTIRRASMADLPRLIELYRNAGHMRRTPAQIENPLRSRRIWLAEIGQVIPAAALTNAETRDLAMIGGVYTDPAYRNQGLSSAVCSALARELLEERKMPVLYWETPAAGAVYRKLGFRPVGNWRSIRLERVGE
jgi:predicted GNAT family acetyltransferase